MCFCDWLYIFICMYLLFGCWLIDLCCLCLGEVQNKINQCEKVKNKLK
jgi:hypothetical protein